MILAHDTTNPLKIGYRGMVMLLVVHVRENLHIIHVSDWDVFR